MLILMKHYQMVAEGNEAIIKEANDERLHEYLIALAIVEAGKPELFTKIEQAEEFYADCERGVVRERREDE
jgi:hypothetical protein